MSDLDLKYNTYPVCPNCGYEDSDAFELGLESDGDSTETECGDCGEEYEVSINISVTYNTYAKDQPNE